MSSTGTALIEAAAAIAIGSALAAAGAVGVRDVLAELERVRTRERALTAARNLIETARAAPCARAGAVTPCPPSIRCTLRRDTLLRRSESAPALVRIRVAAHLDGSQRNETSRAVELWTAIRPPHPCG